MLTREMNAFFLPLLTQGKRDTQLFVFAGLRAAFGTVPGAGKPQMVPVPDYFVYLDISEYYISASVNDALNTTEVVSEDLDRRGKNPRKDIERLARSLIGKLVFERYGVIMGDMTTMSVKLPKSIDYAFTTSKKPNRGWQTISLPRDETYYRLFGQIAKRDTIVYFSKPFRTPTYPFWKVVAQPSELRMKPLRIAYGASIGVGFQDDEVDLTASLELAYRLSHNTSLLGNLTYYSLKSESVLLPIPGNPASPRVEQLRTLVPHFGVGLDWYETSLAYGIEATGWFAPRLLRVAAWVGPGNGRFRMYVAYQSLRQAANNYSFAPFSLTATNGSEDETFEILTFSFGFQIR